ncbi:MAG: aminotransferase class V-fold PLP-dependent enzyme, partial [bacterium]
MEKVFFTPGPTQLYPEVRTFINQALDDNILSLNHRSKEFTEIFRSTCDSLRLLLNIPSDFHIFFLSSATECMDRIIQNVVEKNSFHFVNGAFAERFYKTAVELNKNAVKAEVNYGDGFKFDETKISNDPELIAFTQNETSTGVALNPDDIYRIKEQFPDAIVAVDIVTSAPYVDLDYTKIDCAFFSVQKGFGMPAGLGVLIVNDKCIEKAKSLKQRNISIGSYHNFLALH